MNEKRKIEQRNNDFEITKEDQEAFNTLTKELILADKTREVPRLSYENRKEISTIIQEDFFEYVLRNRTKKQEIIKGVPEEEVKLMKTYDTFCFTAHFSKLAREKSNIIDSSPPYESKSAPLNCVGENFINSTEERLLGKKVMFGIGADHPVLFVTDKEGAHYINDMGAKKEINGTFEERNGYALYRTNSDAILGEHFFFLHDPDVAILHEIFHNMQILKEGIKNPNVFLPDTEDDGLKISEQYQSILQNGDWGKMRRVLCPEVERSFQENKSEWEAEIERIKNERIQPKTIYMGAIKKAKETLGFQDRTMEEFFKFIKPKVQEYKEIVREYFNFLTSKKTDFTPNLPKDKKMESVHDLQHSLVLGLGTFDPKEKRPITDEEVLKLIDDAYVRDFIRDLGDVFVDIKEDNHSVYFRNRLNQNILDESLI